LDYINNAAPADKPFFLVASLVNPHDVLFYPKNFNNSYNDPSLLVGDIKLPPTVNENITYPNKPSVQYNFYKVFELSGALTTTQDKLNYLNFYGNLMKMQDNYLGQVMDALEARGMLDNTVIIRTSDHGEMGLSHHGLRQKNFNFYEQSLRVSTML
jgi:arylsulfatase A-like enzyme